MSRKLILFSVMLLCSTFTIILNDSPLEQIFTQIFEKHLWSGYPETVSGSGSSLQQTTIIREAIPQILKELEIKILLDAPCGDFNWMSKIDLSFLDQYVGVDIVPTLIKKNKLKYEKENRTFICLDVAKNPLPQADMILCRDCFLHLRYTDIFQIIENFKKTGAKYFFASTYSKATENHDVATISSRFRPLNLELPPFNFPKPLLLIDEKDKHGKHLGLWKMEELTNNIAN